MTLKLPLSTENPWALTAGEIASMLAYSELGTVKESAAKLHVSVKTVETHLFRARARMGGVGLVPACIWLDRWLREEEIPTENLQNIKRETRAEQVMALVKKHRVLTRSQLSKDLGISERVASWHLSQLGRRGLLVRVPARVGHIFAWGWTAKEDYTPPAKPETPRPSRCINSVFALGAA